MSLQESIRKNKDLHNDIKCGGCGNILLHCGKYDIVKIGLGRGKRSEEGILCETCQNNGRKLVRVTRIIETEETGHKQVANFLVRDLDTKKIEEEAEQIEEEKIIEAQAIANEEGSTVKDLESDNNKDKDNKKDNKK